MTLRDVFVRLHCGHDGQNRRVNAETDAKAAADFLERTVDDDLDDVRQLTTEEAAKLARWGLEPDPDSDFP
jgi:hypothetical protein